MLRITVTLVLLWMVIVLVNPSAAMAQDRRGWFVGGSISLLELSGSGDINTPDGTIEFDIEALNAIGLVDNRVTNSQSTMGLGWDNTQMPGGSLTIGYRSSFHWAAHMDMFWALPKTAEADGYPGSNPAQPYLDKQFTRATYHTTRLMLDWRPFKPLPLLYLTVGVEHVSFDTRLEFRWQYEDNGETKRYYEYFEDAGNTFGFVGGAGLQFSSLRSPKQEWFINMTYAYAPFHDAYYAWDADFLIGGLALEGGFRYYFGRR